MNRREAPGPARPDPVAIAVWHCLAWLNVACMVGLLLAALLLIPGLNRYLGEWTYGRWVPVHLNLQLYGWCSLPLVAWLLKMYQADLPPASGWSRTAVWSWSAALAVGALSWLNGGSSGKIFLDWKGFARILFPLATFVLWLVLAGTLRCQWNSPENLQRGRRGFKTGGLGVLFFVPLTLFWAAAPGIYPPVNPDTGGPTGASLLESTLGIIVVLLVLPWGLVRRTKSGRRSIYLAWIWFLLGLGLTAILGRSNQSHHRPGQLLGLGSLVPWALLMPAYYGSYDWPSGTDRWRKACFVWWALLLASGWLTFFPGWLDRFKFTDVLVGHAHLAMAGFISSLNVFLLIALRGNRKPTFDARWAFIAWQAGTLGYVLLMFIAGWRESNDASFNSVPGLERNVLYSLRLACGGLMLVASWHWLRCASRLALTATSIPTKHSRQLDASIPAVVKVQGYE